jgi:hypothetical protein
MTASQRRVEEDVAKEELGHVVLTPVRFQVENRPEEKADIIWCFFYRGPLSFNRVYIYKWGYTVMKLPTA